MSQKYSVLKRGRQVKERKQTGRTETIAVIKTALLAIAKAAIIIRCHTDVTAITTVIHISIRVSDASISTGNCSLRTTLPRSTLIRRTHNTTLATVLSIWLKIQTLFIPVRIAWYWTETIAFILIALLTTPITAIVIRILASVIARAAGSDVCVRIGNAVFHATDTNAETHGTTLASTTLARRTCNAAVATIIWIRVCVCAVKAFGTGVTCCLVL
jgi:hypothetical protein